MGSWLKICLDEAEEKRRKTTRRTRSSSNRSFGSLSSGRSNAKKFNFEKKFLNKLEIIDEECSETVHIENPLKAAKPKEKVPELVKDIKIENEYKDPNIGYLKSERGDPVTMRGLEDNDIIIDLTLSEIKKLQQSASISMYHPGEMFEYVPSQHFGPGMSEHGGTVDKENKEDIKKNYESAGGIEEYKEKNKHLMVRSPSFTSSSKHAEVYSGSEKKDDL